MDIRSITQLELQAHLFGYLPIEFCSDLKTKATYLINEGIDELRTVVNENISDVEKSPEEIDEFITSFKNTMLNTCNTATENLLHNMEQLTYVPEYLTLEQLHLELDEDSLHKEQYARYEEAKKELMEQAIVKGRLRRELMEYEQHAAIFAKCENIIKKAKEIHQSGVPESIKQMLTDILDNADAKMLSGLVAGI